MRKIENCQVELSRASQEPKRSHIWNGAMKLVCGEAEAGVWAHGLPSRSNGDRGGAGNRQEFRTCALEEPAKHSIATAARQMRGIKSLKAQTFRDVES